MYNLILYKLLLALSISSVLGAAKSRGCNYRDIEMQDAEITKMSNIMDKSNTQLQAVDKDGKRVLCGMLVFKKDLPLTTQVKWEVYSVEDNNNPKKKSEGKVTPFCNYLVEEKPFADMLISHSNLSATCPYKQGPYWVCGSGPDTRLIPCRSPGSADVWLSKIRLFETNGKVILEFQQRFRLIR